MDYNNGQDIMVNNVLLPNNVVRELQRLGRALEWYSNGELQSAVKACVVDARLVDDENGINFMDKLELTDEEKEKSNTSNECDNETNKPKSECISNKFISFCKRLKESRAQQICTKHEVFSS